MENLKNNKGIVMLVIGFLALIIYNWDKISSPVETQAVAYAEVVTSETSQTLFDNYIMVDIKGEVNQPGLYQVRDTLRIGDVISIAGGTTENADLTEINLSEKIYDEMILTIPKTIEEMVIPDDIVKIVVEIKGEIESPGIYTLDKNSRISDLIEIAGGISSDADISGITSAKILCDGETVIIPKISVTSETTTEVIDVGRSIYVEITGEVINPGVYYVLESASIQDLIYEAGGVTINCDLDSINWDTKLCLGSKVYIPSYTDEIVVDTTDSDKMNINTANLETLINLPGIGLILGQRIIDYRAEYGDFLCIEDIILVSGIKTSIYEQIKELITV